MINVVIVAFRCDQLLQACLESLSSEMAVSLNVLVVDNASQASTRALVESFRFTRYLNSGANVGFARANNFAFEHCGDGPILVLNPDTVVPPGTLAKLLQVLERDPDVGMVGAKLIQPNGELDHACKRGIPSPGASLAYFLRLDRLSPGRLGGYRAMSLGEDEEGDVQAINGAFMLVRRIAFEEVGPFDERFWMYGEDLDWCYRFGQAGWRIRYVPTPVMHVKGGSSGATRNLRTSWAFHRAMWIFYRKHHRRLRHIPVAAVVFLGVHGKFVLGALKKSGASWPRKFVAVGRS